MSLAFRLKELCHSESYPSGLITGDFEDEVEKTFSRGGAFGQNAKRLTRKFADIFAQKCTLNTDLFPHYFRESYASPDAFCFRYHNVLEIKSYFLALLIRIKKHHSNENPRLPTNFLLSNSNLNLDSGFKEEVYQEDILNNLTFLYDILEKFSKENINTTDSFRDKFKSYYNKVGPREGFSVIKMKLENLRGMVSLRNRLVSTRRGQNQLERQQEKEKYREMISEEREKSLRFAEERDEQVNKLLHRKAEKGVEIDNIKIQINEIKNQLYPMEEERERVKEELRIKNNQFGNFMSLIPKSISEFIRNTSRDSIEQIIDSIQEGINVGFFGNRVSEIKDLKKRVFHLLSFTENVGDYGSIFNKHKFDTNVLVKELNEGLIEVPYDEVSIESLLNGFDIKENFLNTLKRYIRSIYDDYNSIYNQINNLIEIYTEEQAISRTIYELDEKVTELNKKLKELDGEYVIFRQEIKSLDDSIKQISGQKYDSSRINFLDAKLKSDIYRTQVINLTQTTNIRLENMKRTGLGVTKTDYKFILYLLETMALTVLFITNNRLKRVTKIDFVEFKDSEINLEHWNFLITNR